MKSTQSYSEFITVVPGVNRRESCLSAAITEKGDSPPVSDLPWFKSGHNSPEEMRRGSRYLV